MKYIPTNNYKEPFMTSQNPFLNPQKRNVYDATPFDEIQTAHFLPAVDAGLKEAEENIEKIKNNPEAPTFKNTIEALELASELLDNVTNIYFNLFGAESDDEFKALAQEISPKLAQFESKVMMDADLFARIKAVYEANEPLGSEQKRLLETNYKSFVRNGALLNAEDKKKLDAINTEMAKLSPQFSQNLLGATNAFELHITNEADIDGITENAKDAAAMEAKKRNKEGWVFTLQAPSVTPFLKYVKNRELREKISRAYSSRAFGDKFNNQEILKRIAVLRHERAQLLGFETHAEYTLQERMAKEPDTVLNFLERILAVAKPVAEKEVEELKELAKKNDKIEEIFSWDASYYSEKLKKIKFDFDEEELRPYFRMENVVTGLFKIANKLYGLNFAKDDSVPVYHQDVNVYKVTDEKDDFVGLLYFDLFPRETKRGGAWMTEFLGQGLSQGKVRRPHVAVVANVTPSTDKQPSLLHFGEVETLFHEFGHALHGLLSDCRYKSLASPNVYWDFVELPSQIMEHWAAEPEVMKQYARHYLTNEPMPEVLMEKLQKSSTFNQGFATVEYLAAAQLDMKWHTLAAGEKVPDAAKFEKQTLEEMGLISEIIPRYRSTYFSHIFNGGYSAGYYVYIWAEVLDSDAFDAFKETGDIFNQELAQKFREHCLADCGEDEGMVQYTKFRGHEPTIDALLRNRGLK